MDIEYIKWLVGYAGENFGLFYKGKRLFINITEFESCEITRDLHLWVDIFYPLLLQRAIEGINTVFRVYTISTVPGGVKVYKEVPMVKYYTYKKYGIDQAKDEALKYIYKQERTK